MATNKNSERPAGIRPGVVIILIAVIAVLVAGKFLGWYGGSKSTGSAASTPGSDEIIAPHGSTAKPGGSTEASRASAPGATPGTASIPNRTTPAPANGVASPGVPNSPNVSGVQPAPVEIPGGTMLKEGEWEQKLDDILGSNEEEKQKAEKLLQMFPLLPEDGQVEVAQHLSNLLEDDRYPALAQTFTNAATPEAVLDVLMADVLNRNNTVKLNTLLDVARTANHPKAEEAKEVLEVFVDEDFGNDWAKWQAAIQGWLKENPDEPDDAGKTPPAEPAVK